VTVEELMRISPVIPVLTIEDENHARPIAEALVAGGLKVIEVTLRTPAALSAIAAMAHVKGAIVGAGTVLNQEDLKRSFGAGAQFIVSPGLIEELVETANLTQVPLLPGIATPSDIMRGMTFGLTHFKFFPAEGLGGVKTLKALAAPFHQCRFCPTGGITPENAGSYLALESVLCVGGGWVVPPGAPNVSRITAMAEKAADLPRSLRQNR
jgi:2-dehydro-3-deoxyphosphogluconate aldolase / (4S)-4-hydroxy-2-oxoglutarate aldolase